jgi:hypothetical protein
MPIKNILLPLVGEPSAATIAAIDHCVAVAGHVELLTRRCATRMSAKPIFSF